MSLGFKRLIILNNSNKNYDTLIHSFIHLLYSINPSWGTDTLVNSIYSIAKHNHLHCTLILIHTMLQITLITTTIIF